MINNFLKIRKNIFLIDFLLLIGLISASAFFAYFTNQVLNLFYHSILLVVFLFSKKNYLWIAYCFILLNRPGSMFVIYFSRELADRSLPVYNFLGVGIPFILIFILIFLLKAIINKNWGSFKSYLSTPYKLIGFLFVLLIFITVYYGSEWKFLKELILINIISFTLFFSLPKLLSNQEELISLLKLLFPFVFVALIFEIVHIAFGNNVLNMITGASNPFSMGDETIIRTDFMPFLNLCCFIFSYVLLKLKLLSSNIFKLIYFLSFLTVFLSATRGWIIAYTFMLLLLILFGSTKIIDVRQIVLLIFLTFVVMNIPLIKNQLTKSANRLNSVTTIIEKDPNIFKTESRLSYRADKIAAAIKNNIIIGYGFSKYYMENRDVHVGNQNIILNCGILGYLVFLYFSFYFIRLNFNLIKFVQGTYKDIFRIFIISFLGIFIIHSTSTQIFGFDQVTSQIVKIYFLALYFTSFGILTKSLIQKQSEIPNNINANN